LPDGLAKTWCRNRYHCEQGKAERGNLFGYDELRLLRFRRRLGYGGQVVRNDGVMDSRLRGNDRGGE